ncbi:surface lipoprotein assembly modifier [Providencia rettgeri]|uniref:surface lipoprotein assembly modifier n=1 Tax=Providencia rettgeri TaxID=587 RepID=UPI0034E0C095
MNMKKISILIVIFLFGFHGISNGQYMSGSIHSLLNKTDKKGVNSAKKYNKNIDEISFILYDLTQGKQFEKVDSLLVDYLNEPEYDKTLVNYIRAERFIYEGKYNQAIESYLKVLDDEPNVISTNLKLAKAYLVVKNYVDALKQYQAISVKFHGKLTDKQKNIVDNSIKNIENRYKWHKNINFSMAYNSNIDQAQGGDKQYCAKGTCITGQPTRASMVNNFYLSSTTMVPLRGQHTWMQGLTFSGVDYLRDDSKRKVTVQANGGYQFADNNKKLALIPSGLVAWQNNQFHYYKISGKGLLEVYPSQILSIYASVDVNEYQYNKRYAAHDGNERIYSLGLVYILNTHRKLIIRGSNVSYNKQLESDSYRQYELSVSAFNYIHKTEIANTIGYRKTKFNRYDWSLDTQRVDHYWYFKTQFNKTNFKILQFSPSIYFNYQINNSSADVIYSYKQSEFGVNFSKAF